MSLDLDAPWPGLELEMSGDIIIVLSVGVFPRGQKLRRQHRSPRVKRKKELIDSWGIQSRFCSDWRARWSGYCSPLAR